jgi:competence protein ComFC
MLKLLEKMLDFIFPIECITCGAKGFDICSACVENTLPPKLSNYDWITSFGNYHDPIIKDIMWHIKKYPNGRAAQILAKAFGEMIRNRPEDPTSWILIPIPISKKRFRERGYNQAELIAQPLAKTFGLKTSSKILFKSKHTNKQGTAKSKEDRAHNILGSFEIVKKYQNFIQNKNIILIDDITTTGSTLIEAREILLHAGVKRVIAWTIAN